MMSILQFLLLLNKYSIVNKIYHFIRPIMATITHYIPSTSINLICSRGGLHEQQALNLVCLDPLCRSNPLCCSVCFSQVHKYHKVVALSKFLDDYKRNIGSTNANMLQKKINKHYDQLTDHVHKFKQYFLRQIDHFEKALEKYAEYLSCQSHIRNCVGNELNIQLQPSKINNIRSQQDLQRTLRFILNNSLFDSNLNMINASDIFKQNQERVCALLDKMVYMTQFCQTSIKQALSSLKFANKTIKSEKIQLQKKINKLMDAQPDPTSLKNYMQQKSRLKKIIQQTGCLVLEESQKVWHMHQWDRIPKTAPQYLFGRYKHKQLDLKNNGTAIGSNVNGLKPHYALAWPNINLQPQEVKEWSIKINKCRDFSTQNTMAVGISRLSDMKLSDYQGYPTNCLMISSQGFVTLNGKSQKTAFTFREGDTVYFKYDPFYGTLQVKKQNCRRLTLRALGNDEPVYACVRFTYASDQVQFV